MVPMVRIPPAEADQSGASESSTLAPAAAASAADERLAYTYYPATLVMALSLSLRSCVRVAHVAWWMAAHLVSTSQDMILAASYELLLRASQVILRHSGEEELDHPTPAAKQRLGLLAARLLAASGGLPAGEVIRCADSTASGMLRDMRESAEAQGVNYQVNFSFATATLLVPGLVSADQRIHELAFHIAALVVAQDSRSKAESVFGVQCAASVLLRPGLLPEFAILLLRSSNRIAVTEVMQHASGVAQQQTQTPSGVVDLVDVSEYPVICKHDMDVLSVFPRIDRRALLACQTIPETVILEFIAQCQAFVTE